MPGSFSRYPTAQGNGGLCVYKLCTYVSVDIFMPKFESCTSPTSNRLRKQNSGKKTRIEYSKNIILLRVYHYIV